MSVPEDVQALIRAGKLADARQMCVDLNLSTSEIDKRVERIRGDVNYRLMNRDYLQLQKDFISTIGLIDPAFVCGTFIDVVYHPYLMEYLIELHKRGKAEKSHTELLFELFDQCGDDRKLVAFMDTIKDATNRRDFDPDARLFLENFDVETAVEILTKNGKEQEAFQLACDLECVSYRLSLFISYKKDFEAAMSLLEKDYHAASLMKYGPQLLEKTGSYEPIHKRIVKLASDLWLSKMDQARVGTDVQYMRLFSSSRKYCLDFLRSVIDVRPTRLFRSVFIVLLIPQYGSASDSLSDKDKALTLIREQWGTYDDEYVLRACCAAEFMKGKILLLTLKGRFDEVVGTLISKNECSMLMDWFTENEGRVRDENHKQKLLYDVFEYFATQFDWLMSLPKGMEFFQHLIELAHEKLPFGVVLELLLRGRNISVGIIRQQLTQYAMSIEAERKQVLDAREKALKALGNAEVEIDNLEYCTREFKNARCHKCQQTLDLPFVCLMSGHAYHQSCFDSLTTDPMRVDQEEAVQASPNLPLASNGGWDSVCEAIGRGILESGTS